MKRSMLLFIVSCVVLAAMLYSAAWLLDGDETAVVSAQRDMRALSINLSIIRISLIGAIILFGWPLMTRLIYRWCSVDIASLRLKVTGWYLIAEAAILLSLWSTT